MRLPGLKTVRLAGLWLRGRLGGGVPILGYHRVADRGDDPYDLCVSRRNFAEQIEVLRRVARPVALAELVGALGARKLPRRAVAVTFDDGYADNLHHALPELERHEVPATVFVASGQLGGRFWWDELARILDGASAGLERLAPVLEEILGDGQPAERAVARPRRQVLASLAQRLQRMSAEERSSLLRRLGGPAPVDDDSSEADRALTREELCRLAASDAVEIGSHTVGHAALAALPADRQEAEILDGKRTLEEILGFPVTSFAYPHGSIGAATPGLVKKAGFRCACSSFKDLALPGSDPYRLPRFWVGDWDGARFARWLRRWVGR